MRFLQSRPGPRRRPLLARGVTLIEMMVVVAIVGIIAALAVPNLTPVVQNSSLSAEVQRVGSTLERARRLAMNQGRCHRVRLNGGNLLLERRSNANCGYCPPGQSNCNRVDPSNDISAATGWDPALFTLRPETGLVYDDLEVSPNSIGAGTTNASIVFRPNGRLRGDGDMDVTDEGARIVIKHNQLSERVGLVLVESTGRICFLKLAGTNTAPTFAAPIVCGGFSGGGSSGGGGGGGCSQAGHNTTAIGALALLGMLFVPRLRRRRERAPVGKRRRAPRGYLLIEVMLSGAILALILATTLSIVADARVQTTKANNRAIASDIGQYYLHLMASCNHHNGGNCPITSACPTPAHPVIAANKPGFAVTCDVANSGLEGASTPNLFNAAHLQQVEIVVTYPDYNDNPDDLTYKTYRRNRPFSS